LDIIDEFDSLKKTNLNYLSKLEKLNPEIEISKLKTILFDSKYPLSFLNFLKTKSISQQKQFLTEFPLLPPHLQDLNAFSTKLNNTPALSIAYREYLQYRLLYKSLNSSEFFSQHCHQSFFLSHYNPPVISERIFVTNNSTFFSILKSKSTTTAQFLSYISPSEQPKPSWLVIAHIPIEVTLQKIRGIVSRQTGFVDCILLPPEPKTLTKMAFVAYNNTTSRDNACTALNGTLSPQDGTTTTTTATTDQTTQQSSDLRQQVTDSASSAPYKLYVFPWISTSQYDIDSSFVTPSKPLQYRQPIAPVGLKQWLTGPIPLSVLVNRLQKDISNALLFAQFFDYVRLVPVESNIDELLEYVWIHGFSVGSGGSSSAHNQFDVSSQMSKFRFLLKYLREVHYFDYFTTTLYPSKEALSCDIPTDWVFIDPPTISPQQSKLYSHLYTNPTSTLFPLPTTTIQQLQTTLGNTSNTANKSAGTKLAQNSSFFSNALVHIPFDQSLPMEQTAITAFYNAVLAVSPPSHHVNGNVTKTIDTKINFWNVQFFYQEMFYPIYSSKPQPPIPLVDNPDAVQLPDILFTQGTSDNQIGGLNSEVIKTPYRSQDVEFWSNIDSAAGRVEILFDLNQINRTVTPTLDNIDTDLCFLPSTFFPPALSTSLLSYSSNDNDNTTSGMGVNGSGSSGSSSSGVNGSSNTVKQKVPISPLLPPVHLKLPTKFSKLLFLTQLFGNFKQLLSNRFECQICHKLLDSTQNMLKHMNNAHNDDRIAGVRSRLLQNLIYFRFINDGHKITPNGTNLTNCYANFVKHFFQKEKKNQDNNNNNQNNNTLHSNDLLSLPYRLMDLPLYKRELIVCGHIEAAWADELNKIKGMIKFEEEEEESKKNDKKMSDEQSNDKRIKKQVNSSSNNNNDGYNERNLVLEQRAEEFRQEHNLTQLFKGFDGDNYGTGKALPREFGYDDPNTQIDEKDENKNEIRAGKITKKPIPQLSTLNNNNNNNNNQNASKHCLYQHIQSLIDTEQQHQRGAESIPFYGDIVNHYGFDLSWNYGLEPFVGQE
jgi:hypothetical protein